MGMKRKTIAEHMRDVLVERGFDSVIWGDVGPVSQAITRAGVKAGHPLDRHQRVINALERSPLFEKRLVHAMDSRGRRRVVRGFKLIASTASHDQAGIEDAAETSEETAETPFCVRCHEEFPVADEPAGWVMGQLRPVAAAPRNVRQHWSVNFDAEDIRGKPMLCGNCYFDLMDEQDFER